MSLFHNVTRGPVVIDGDGRVLPGGESGELGDNEHTERAVAAGHLHRADTPQPTAKSAKDKEDS